MFERLVKASYTVLPYIFTHGPLYTQWVVYYSIYGKTSNISYLLTTKVLDTHFEQLLSYKCNKSLHLHDF